MTIRWSVAAAGVTGMRVRCWGAWGLKTTQVILQPEMVFEREASDVSGMFRDAGDQAFTLVHPDGQFLSGHANARKMGFGHTSPYGIIRALYRYGFVKVEPAAGLPNSCPVSSHSTCQRSQAATSRKQPRSSVSARCLSPASGPGRRGGTRRARVGSERWAAINNRASRGRRSGVEPGQAQVGA